MPEHFLQPRLVLAHRRVGGTTTANCASSSAQSGPCAVGASLVREPVVDEPASRSSTTSPASFSRPRCRETPGLGDAENAGQLADVEAVLRQHAQQAEAGAVGQQAEEGGSALH